MTRAFNAFKNLLIINLILFVLAVPFFVTAQSDLSLPEQKVYPGTISYPLKRSWEKFWEKITNSDKDKMKLYRDLTLTRLSELNYVVDKGLVGETQTSSERFAFYAGQLTNAATRVNDGDEKNNISQDFDKYIQKLETMRDKYEYGSSYWMLIMHSINSLKEYKEKLK